MIFSGKNISKICNTWVSIPVDSSFVLISSSKYSISIELDHVSITKEAATGVAPIIVDQEGGW